MTAITSTGEDSIRKNIEISPILNLSENYERYFEVDKCVKWIVDNGYERVALQFPDELLHLTVLVYNSISKRIGGARAYVLADSTYGSCCIDEKTAAHINADALIHFGHTCGSSRKTKAPCAVCSRPTRGEYGPAVGRILRHPIRTNPLTLGFCLTRNMKT
jgi:hypothetical protein